MVLLILRMDLPRWIARRWCCGVQKPDGLWWSVLYPRQRWRCPTLDFLFCKPLPSLCSGRQSRHLLHQRASHPQEMGCGTQARDLCGFKSGFPSEMVTSRVSHYSWSQLVSLTVRTTAMTPGGTAQEVTQLNIESLWTGGLWQDPVRSHFVSAPSRTDSDMAF